MAEEEKGMVSRGGQGRRSTPPSPLDHPHQPGSRRPSFTSKRGGDDNEGDATTTPTTSHPPRVPPPSLPPVSGAGIHHRPLPPSNPHGEVTPPPGAPPPLHSSALHDTPTSAPSPPVTGSLLQRPDPLIRHHLVVPPGPTTVAPAVKRKGSLTGSSSANHLKLASRESFSLPGARRMSHEGRRESLDADDHHTENDMRGMSWSERVDVTFEANSPVGITFEWRHGVLEVTSFTKVSPARDSNKVTIGMVLTAIDGVSVLSMNQREVLNAMQASARNHRTLTFCLPLSKAAPPPTGSVGGGSSSAALTKSRRGPGWTKADALQPLDRKNKTIDEDALSDSSELTDDEWPIADLPSSYKFDLLDSTLPSQPQFRRLYRRKWTSKNFLRKYRGLFPEFDDVSTPARRRRIIHEVAKFAYIHYRSTACYNVLQWRKEQAAAIKIQSSYRRMVTQRWYKEALRVHKLTAATAVQKWVRRYLAQLVASDLRLDRLIQRQGIAAIQIQAAVRMLLARNAKAKRAQELETERLQKEKAASTIQRALQRQVSIKKEMEEEQLQAVSTTKIQAVFRRHKCQVTYKDMRAEKLKHVTKIQKVYRGYYVRRTRRQEDAANVLTKVAKRRWLPEMRESRRKLLAQQEAQRAQEEEAERQRHLEKGQVAAEEAAHLARMRLERQSQELEQAASLPSAVPPSVEEATSTQEPTPPGTMTPPGQIGDPSQWAPSTDSLFDSLDLLASKLDSCSSAAVTLDLHSLDPFREEVVIDMLVQMERGRYPDLAACFDEFTSLQSGQASAAEYLSFLIHASARKIQGSVRDWKQRKEAAAGCISRGLKTAHNRHKAYHRARSLSGSTVAVQTLVRSFLARARTRRLRLARLSNLSRHLQAMINNYEPCLLTPGLINHRRRALLLAQAAHPTRPPPPPEDPKKPPPSINNFWGTDVLKLSEPPPGCLCPWDQDRQAEARLPKLRFRFS